MNGARIGSWAGHPAGVLILTAGIDVQRDRIEIDVWGWGRNLRSWLVDHVVLEGDTARAEVWADLNEFLGLTWEHASGARMALARVAIDSGDGATTDAVYAWVRQAGHGQVIAIKGVAGFDRSTPVDGPTYVETTEGGRKLRRGVRLWKVAGAVFKAETYRFLRLAAPDRRGTGGRGRLARGLCPHPEGHHGRVGEAADLGTAGHPQDPHRLSESWNGNRPGSGTRPSIAGSMPAPPPG
jgi:phage terminase large subunit GpA-like protein